MMNNMKYWMIVAALMGSMTTIKAQSSPSSEEASGSAHKIEIGLGADVVSQYIWRGMELGHPSLQPQLSAAWKGLSLSAWGNIGLTNNNDARELDLTLSYSIGGLSVGVNDYWADGFDTRYFYYKHPDTGHSFEGFVAYDFGILNVSWQTFFAGYDHMLESDRRAYSSYFEVGAPFRLATCEWRAAAGFVPWKSDYYSTTGFAVTNLSLRAMKEVKITDSFSLPLFGELIANPCHQNMYFVFGFTVKAL